MRNGVGLIAGHASGARVLKAQAVGVTKLRCLAGTRRIFSKGRCVLNSPTRFLGAPSPLYLQREGKTGLPGPRQRTGAAERIRTKAGQAGAMATQAPTRWADAGTTFRRRA